MMADIYSRIPSKEVVLARGRSRSCFVLSLHKEIDWYGRKKSTLFVLINGWHPSKPENVDGIIRGTYDSFAVITPDDNEPETACKILVSNCNNYKRMATYIIVTKAVPRNFNKSRQDAIKAFKT